MGGLVGYLAFRGFRPLVASVIALAIELPYVVVTDLIYLQWSIVQIILNKLTVETLISAGLASILVRSSAIKALMSGFRA